MKSKSKASKISIIKPVSINWKLWLGMDKINKFQAIGLTIPIPPEQIKVKLRRNNFYAELQNGQTMKKLQFLTEWIVVKKVT